jgi:hypothetical protein
MVKTTPKSDCRKLQRVVPSISVGAYVWWLDVANIILSTLTVFARALITSYLCDTVLLSFIPFVQALGPCYDVLPLCGMSGFPQYG